MAGPASLRRCKGRIEVPDHLIGQSFDILWRLKGRCSNLGAFSVAM